MKLLITGATGLIGSEIIKLCKEKEYVVNYLTTSKHKIKNSELVKGFYWNPSNGEIDENCIKGVDTIINLAGASISKRWTLSYKKVLINSRVEGLQLLYRLLSKRSNDVKNIISASAIGVYPSSYTKEYHETDEGISESFLGTIIKAWENEVDEFLKLNMIVSKIRIGIVLSEKGGALEQMVKPIRFGVGAPLGNGKQYQSWIHSNDLAKLFLFVAEKKLKGVYNAVAHNPITNKELTKAIAKQMNKPLWLPNVPAFLLKLILGEMSTIVLESQKVSNAKIVKEGFEFEYKAINETLNNLF